MQGGYVSIVNNRNPRIFDSLPWAFLFGIWLLTFFYMSTPMSDGVWCVWRALFNLHCPGCGLTSSFCSMSAGDWTQAFQHHRAGPSLYGALTWCVFVWPLRTVFKTAKFFRLPKWLMLAYWGFTALLFAAQTLRVVELWSVAS